MVFKDPQIPCQSKQLVWLADVISQMCDGMPGI